MSHRFQEHDTGDHHPENKNRLRRTMDRLQHERWSKALLPVEARAAEVPQIERVHTPSYVKRARRQCHEGRSYLDTPDVAISKGSYDTALLAAGSALELCDLMMNGRIRNGFALLRPPGHHAERDFAMGFCLFNNAAIAARHFQDRHGLERILILDWDVHHGNGTQHLFEEDPSILYVSLHQYPFYPGTGSSWETGVGKGSGATVNCPMKAGAGDAEYQQAFRERIDPAVRSFRPDAIILSSGFDAHRSDPLGAIELEADSYGWMSRYVMEWAEHTAKGRVLSLLEGGYHPRALADCVERHLEVLASVPRDTAPPPGS